MSAKDAEVTEEDRRAAAEAIYGHMPINGMRGIKSWVEGRMPGIGQENAVAQALANYRRDAYRAGQIAGLEEGFKIAMTYSGWATNAECEAKLDARIRELKGEA